VPAVTGVFSDAVSVGLTLGGVGDRPSRRGSPFSLRLSQQERARLTVEAAGAPLGAYIKAKVLDTQVPVRMRRTGLSIEDRKSLAQVLALLGRSRLSSNLNQLAQAVNIGALPMTPETEAELFEVLREVRALRSLLMSALGLKAEDAP
jgi:hypothetical protein